ncbi:type II toxin-antitoxin system prevent-host-death family antitoxin [Brevibacterium sp. JSBI002]|uniref:type II toxin-antitoxin system prevent-host-death family antitoxin n=1 Tax=Brevibacterium sp. JSBI002 TaxID=2886045 RepID=UPI0022319943|nr:type II toxin-antitoxin system prevent-host-death family antitoxin [Brevibacterium sp. JSBI002]UZD62236.1 type II toxin-antitoxin system prevent-host-death family antitoxin [Brevibacterium sp. JSBI002]
MTTMSSREFNRDVSAAKRAARHGPVTITEHGRRTHVLLTADEYDQLSGRSDLVGDALVIHDDDSDLDLPHRSQPSLRVPEL